MRQWCNSLGFQSCGCVFFLVESTAEKPAAFFPSSLGQPTTQRNAPATRCLQGPHLPAAHAYQSGPPRLCLTCSWGPLDPPHPHPAPGPRAQALQNSSAVVSPAHAWWAKSIMTGFTSKGRPCEARLPHNWRSHFGAEIILIPLFFSSRLWIHERVRRSWGYFLTAQASLCPQPSAGVTTSGKMRQYLFHFYLFLKITTLWAARLRVSRGVAAGTPAVGAVADRHSEGVWLTGVDGEMNPRQAVEFSLQFISSTSKIQKNSQHS